MRIDSTPDAALAGQIGYILRAPLRLYIPSAYFGHVQHGLHQELERLDHRLIFLGAEDELTPAKLRQFFHPSNRLGGVVVLGEAAARLVAGAGVPAEGYSDLVLPAPLVVGNSAGPAR